jgi:hypothetical protein
MEDRISLMSWILLSFIGHVTLIVFTMVLFGEFYRFYNNAN